MHKLCGINKGVLDHFINFYTVVYQMVHRDGPNILANVAEIVQAVLTIGQFGIVHLAKSYGMVAVFVVEADKFFFDHFLVAHTFDN